MKLKRLKWLKLSFLGVVLSHASLVWACGPSPQKATEEVVIQASVNVVWQQLRDFAKVQEWHPAVLVSELAEGVDANQQPFKQRTLHLKSGGVFVQKQRYTEAEMQLGSDSYKLGTVMLSGDMPVSNYSDLITVKPGSQANQTVVTWVGRFNNQANAMQAPEGQDDAAAMASVKSFYQLGLAGLKQAVESQSVSGLSKRSQINVTQP